MQWKILLSIGKTITSLILRYKINGDAADTVGDFFDTFSTIYGNYEEGKIHILKNKVEGIYLSISEACLAILQKHNIADVRKEIIARDVLEAYRAIQLDVDLIAEMRANPLILEHELLRHYQNYKDDLEEKEITLYEHLIQYTSFIVVNSIKQLPEFYTSQLLRIDFYLDEIKSQMVEILKELSRIVATTGDNYSDFVASYKLALINKLRFIEIQGSGANIRDFSKYELESSYVELELDLDTYSSSLSRRLVQLDEIFVEGKKNAWISGEVGAGKTTLLQWIGINIARDKFCFTETNKLIPIFISVRSLKEYALRTCIEDVMKNSSYRIPDNWLDIVINEKVVLLLIDGLDEISEENRYKLYNWIKDFDPENNCYKIFSARKHIEVPKFLTNHNCRKMSICSLTLPKIKAFIENWHYSVLVKQLYENRISSHSRSIGLYNRIITSDSLRKLSSNPLMCAMICSLNYISNGNIPDNKKQLYDDCINMLLENRDRAREIVVKQLYLTLSQKRLIASKLAYWMMRNGFYTEVSCELALKQFKMYCEDMGIAEKDTSSKMAQDLLDYFIQRTGLIRLKEGGIIEFVHRSFLEYLCALQIIRENDLKAIYDRVGNDAWRETIIDAIGFASKNEATQLIEWVISSNTDESVKYGDRRKWFFALALSNSAEEIDPVCREKVRNKISDLIPPKTKEEERLLAMDARNDAIPFLKNKETYSLFERLSCIRTLANIGGVESLPSLITYLDNKTTLFELRVMCGVLDQCNNESIIGFGVPQLIFDFYTNNNDIIVINDVIVRIMSLLKDNSLVELCNLSKNVELQLETEESKKILFANRFQNITTLIIKNNSNSNIELVRAFPNVNNLYIEGKCTIYTFNAYIEIFEHIKRLYLILDVKADIEFDKINYIKHCELVEAIFLNGYEEINFDSLQYSDYNGSFKIGCVPDNILLSEIRSVSGVNEYARRQITILTDSSLGVQMLDGKHIKHGSLMQEANRLEHFNIDINRGLS